METGMLRIFGYLTLSSLILGNYVEGAAPKTYCRPNATTQSCKSEVPLFVNRLNSESLLVPYEYNYFDFCTANELSPPAENLGQVLFGDRIRQSPYEIQFLMDKTCVELCTKQYSPDDPKSARELSLLRRGIRQNYQHNWIIDDMPVIWCYYLDTEAQECKVSFPMGSIYTRDPKKTWNVRDIGYRLFANIHGWPPLTPTEEYQIFNHVELQITYHSGEGEDWSESSLENGGQITSIKVIPRSIKHEIEGDRLSCDTYRAMLIPEDQWDPFNITYTYSVVFVKNNSIKWSSRWHHLLESVEYTKIDTSSILISLAIVLLLSGTLSIILLRSSRKDFVHLNQNGYEKDIPEDNGSKVILVDVFYPPYNRMVLAVFVGSGIQILLTTLITLVLPALGFFSPESRGAVATFALYFYTCLSILAGYVSAYLYKRCGGERWKTNTLLTALLVPGIIFTIFFVSDQTLRWKESSAAVPPSVLIRLLLMWLSIYVPLSVIGSFFGFRTSRTRYSDRTSLTPRKVLKRFALKPIIGAIIGYLLPSGCIYFHLDFILHSLWSSSPHISFGFLFLVLVLLVITCSETTVLLCFFHLRVEKDYRWRWFSFYNSGYLPSALLFIYSVFYFSIFKLNIHDSDSKVLYFGYTLIVVFLFFLMTGSIGFLASDVFVRKIYGADSPTGKLPINHNFQQNIRLFSEDKKNFGYANRKHGLADDLTSIHAVKLKG